MKIADLNKVKWIALVLALIFLFGGSAMQSCTAQHELESSLSDADTSSKTQQYGPIAWPTMGPATMLPTPELLNGRICWDYSNSFAAYISPFSSEQYSSYVNACIEKGFTVDYSRSDSRYSAHNAEGYSLSLSYKSSDSEMHISITAPKEETATNEQTETAESAPEPAPQSTSSTSASFKETMDSYEKFIDDYIAFMQKYNSSGDPVSMLGDYTKFMAQYADTMKKLDDIDENSLTPEDEAYYLEVMTRINKKLSDAALAM